MRSANDEYQDKALEFLEMAERVSEPNFRRELLHIAMEYAASAEQSGNRSNPPDAASALWVC
jgi:hypothetical protein